MGRVLGGGWRMKFSFRIPDLGNSWVEFLGKRYGTAVGARRTQPSSAYGLSFSSTECMSLQITQSINL